MFGEGATGLNLFKTVSSTGDLLQDFFDTGRPDEGRWVGVPRCQKGGDGLLQILDATKDAPAHGLLAEFGKPAFDQVEPTGTGGDEVQDEARMFGQPAANSFMAMGTIIIQDQVERHVARKLLVEAA